MAYDRPAVFTADGAVAIASPRRSPPYRVATGHPAISAAAAATDVSEDLIAAVAWIESRMKAGAVSRTGARGEMQLMPGTARALGVDATDTRQNYLGGASYLRSLMHRYDGDIVKTLAAYNAGPGAVDRFGGVPPYRETQAYVAAVLDRMSLAASATTR